MLFSSIVFLFIFLPIVIIIYYGILPNRTLKNIFLLIASLFFYAYGEPSFVLVMIGSIIINYILGLIINKAEEKDKKKLKLATLIIGVVANLSVLFIYKYLNFTVHNLNLLFGADMKLISVMLPIGISFFTFQAMSYIFDVYSKKIEVQKDPFKIGLYISLFPALISGPIVRYETIADQMDNRTESIEKFSDGIVRFIYGLGKKVIIANTMAVVADTAFGANINEISLGFAFLGAAAYMMQIYFDFSGYSDMAIGLGKIFGFNFLENFNYPYISKSITEFWRRWHISLGTWFKDYVYIPLRRK